MNELCVGVCRELALVGFGVGLGFTIAGLVCGIVAFCTGRER